MTAGAGASSAPAATLTPRRARPTGEIPAELSAIFDPLHLAFATKALRQLCESEATAKRELGNVAAARLRGRLADLRAAPCASDLVAGHPRALDGDMMSVALDERFSIVFRANHNATPERSSGGVNWAEVRRVQIVRIESAP